MKYAEIQDALDAHVAQVPGLPPLQGDNTREAKQPPPFARVVFKPNESGRIGQRTKLQGSYIVDLYYPLGEGKSACNAMADAVMTHFRNAPLHRLQGDGVDVQLEKEWCETVGRAPGSTTYALQVKVRWHALV